MSDWDRATGAQLHLRPCVVAHVALDCSCSAEEGLVLCRLRPQAMLGAAQLPCPHARAWELSPSPSSARRDCRTRGVFSGGRSRHYPAWLEGIDAKKALRWRGPRLRNEQARVSRCQAAQAGAGTQRAWRRRLNGAPARMSHLARWTY